MRFLATARGVILVRWLPVSPDPSNYAVGRLVVADGGERQWEGTPGDDLCRALSLVRAASEERQLLVLFWDCKPLFSAAFWCMGRPAPFLAFPESQDVCYRERFLGVAGEPPKTVREAAARLGACKGGREVHRAVHLPLAQAVLPGMELAGVTDRAAGRVVYPLYDVEGQANGRLNATAPAPRFYNPHTLSAAAKASLVPPGYGRTFVRADFRALELVVLAHLSGDPGLVADAAADDPYLAALRRLFTNVPDDPAVRGVAKGMLLPVFYGLSPPALAAEFGVSVDYAKHLWDEVRGAYPVATRLLAEAERAAAAGEYVGPLGSKRTFDGRFYAARNALVQRAGAVFCQERLVELAAAVAGLAVPHASVHDEFLLSCPAAQTADAAAVVRHALEGESRLFPGLSARVSVSAGPTAAALTALGGPAGSGGRPAQEVS